MSGDLREGRIVIVGASVAGLRAAETLREEGFTGSLTVVGEEPYPPYDRPPLSKQVLLGRVAADATGLPMRRDPHAQWRLGVRATGLVLGIDPSRTPERRNAALSWRQPSTGSEIQRSRPTRSQTTWMFRPVVWCLPEWSSGWLSQLQQLTKVPSTISCSSLGNSSAVGVNGRIIRASAGVIAVIAREIVDWDTP